MTERELSEIEAANGKPISAVTQVVADLVAEVRRLRGLVKAVEYNGDSGGARDWAACPWCAACVSTHYNGKHAADCRAFTESGDAK